MQALVKPVSPVLQRGHPLAPGLVAAWPFYEGAGNRANDLTGNNNTGTFTNGPTWVGSPFGQAIKFTAASSQYIDCGNNPSLQITGAITIAAWVMFTTVANAQIVAKDNDTGGRAYTFDYDSSSGGHLRFYINGGSSLVVSDTFAPNIGQWYHVAGTFIPSSAMSIYIDGQKRGGAIAGDNSIPSATTNCRIGARAYTGFNGFFDGAIAGVQIWNRALPINEINQDNFDSFAICRGPAHSPWWEILTAGGSIALGNSVVLKSTSTEKPTSPVLQRSNPLARGLVAAFPFSEGAGPNLYDLSDNRNNLTAPTGSPTWTGGDFGSALSFGGSDQYTNSAINLPVGASAAWTFGAWINTTINTSLSCPMAFGPALPNGTSNGQQRGLLQFNGHYYFWGQNADWDTGVALDLDGRWHRIVFTTAGGSTTPTINLYRDGKLAASGSPGAALTTAASSFISLGSKHPSAATLFVGELDGFFIANRQWSAAEAALDYFDPFAVYRPPLSPWWETGLAPPSFVPYNPWLQRAPVLAQ